MYIHVHFSKRLTMKRNTYNNIKFFQKHITLKRLTPNQCWGFLANQSKLTSLYGMLYTVASQYLSNGGHICCFRVESRLSFLDLFLRSSRESNEPFLGAASVISRPFIFQVSIAGKHFSIKTSLKFMLS